MTSQNLPKENHPVQIFNRTGLGIPKLLRTSLMLYWSHDHRIFIENAHDFKMKKLLSFKWTNQSVSSLHRVAQRLKALLKDPPSSKLTVRLGRV